MVRCAVFVMKAPAASQKLQELFPDYCFSAKKKELTSAGQVSELG